MTVFPLFCGCGPLYYISETEEHKKTRKEGYELCHLQSCGPEAISDVYRCFGEKRDAFDIGKEIQDRDRIYYRSILSTIHHDFTRITCPPELLSYLRYKNFKIRTVKNLEKLSIKDIAIVLIRGRDDISDWHYITYPTYSIWDIENFFDEDTIVKKVYIIER